MSDQAAWTGAVIRKSRGLLDGSNLYRRLTVRYDDGGEARIRVSRSLWKQIEVGDRLVKEPGQDPRPA